MDRDKRWERTQRAWRAIALGQGTPAAGAVAAVDDAYAAGESDEFVSPRVVAGYDGIRADADGAIHANFRADRARQLTRALADEAFDGFERPAPRPLAAYACMTRYDETFPWPVAYPKVHLTGTLGEVVARRGWKQLRCAETEKYAHVTYFFSGGEETPFPGEDRVLVPSPKDVATYDLAPEMSAKGVADAVVSRVESGAYDFVLVNFANPDMVGHTGVLPAAVRAVEAVDAALGRIVDVVRRQGGVVLVTADHGNCETMRDPQTGGPHTAHTTNPVPLVLVDDGRIGAVLREGRICDVAPTLLEIMEVDKPDEMTGLSLLGGSPGAVGA
jgi:2,3-bisphosphoglycerate-independent phosphoglycerate mutase